MYTNYKVAVNWLNNSLILCNDIVEKDSSVYENCRFNLYDEVSDSYTEIYQWYLTDCSQSDVEFLEEHFELKFSYSDMLDLYILCVDHYGTAWDYVNWYTNLETAQRNLGEEK